MAAIPKAAEHFNGTATTTPAEITFTGPSRSIFIQNTAVSAANDLQVSFDGGSTYKSLKRLAAVSIEVKLNSIFVRSSAGSVAYESVVTHD